LRPGFWQLVSTVESVAMALLEAVMVRGRAQSAVEVSFAAS
jgi:hypothetical protein